MPGRLTDRQLYAPVDEKFGRLYVLAYAGRRPNMKHYYTCRCDCGSVGEYERSHLLRGRTKSCGCLRDDKNHERNYKHGHSLNNGKKTPTYRAWAKLKQLFNNPDHVEYHNYGGAGLELAHELEDFNNFLELIGEQPSPYHKLEVDTDCELVTAFSIRWVLHTKYRRLLDVDGRTLSVADWSRETGIPVKTIYQRLKYGWSHDKVVKTPVRERATKEKAQEKSIPLRELLTQRN